MFRHSSKLRLTLFTLLGTGAMIVIPPAVSYANANLSLGDLNKSGKVDTADISYLLSYFNRVAANADINGDGIVNIRDLSILLSNIGKTIPNTPQPAAPLLEETFSAGTISAKKWWVTSCTHTDGTNGIEVVNDPIRPGGKSARFTVYSNDTVSGCTPGSGSVVDGKVHTSTNVRPRAQLQTDELSFKNGDDFYVNFGTLFPAAAQFPEFTDPNRQGRYSQIAQIYGPPFGNSPVIAMNVVDENNGYTSLQLSGTVKATGETQVFWSANKPLPRNSWEQITWHVKLSPDPSVGYLEMWYNGVQQKFTDGKTRKYLQTLYDGKNWVSPDGVQYVYINSYRSKDMLEKSILYHDDIRIGKTFDSVQPR